MSDKEQSRTVSRFREILPQVLAMGAANCIVLDMSVTFFFSTLIIADLHDPSKELSLDDTQASWFGGLPYLCQPVGSIASGFLVTWFGRKRSLMLITLPYLLSCVLVSTAPSVSVLFITNVVVGMTVGFTEAPLNSYFGEICQPEYRSVLAGSASLYYQFGMFLVLLLGSFMHWKTTAAVSAVMPILTLLLLIPVPESPIWLIAQGRTKDAEAALCWLRGWVHPSVVQKELEELVTYYRTVTRKRADYTVKCKRNSNEDTACMQIFDINKLHETPEQTSLLIQNGKQSTNGNLTTKQATENNEVSIQRNNSAPALENCPLSEVTLEACEKSKHDSKWSKFVAGLKLLLEPETLRPLILVFLIFVFSGMGGMASIKPFMVEVLQRFQSPLDPKWSSVVVAATGFLGSIFLIASVRGLGKRMVGLSTTAVCAVSCLLLGLYASLAISPASDAGETSNPVLRWLPLVLFAFLSFASTAQGQLPWLLLAECFPFRTRGVAGGLSAASMYLVAFFASKTYLSTEKSFHLHGTFWFFGAINCLCFIYLYFQLPETEGKSLQEIESLFAGKRRRNLRDESLG